jgi:conjugative transfer region lipoprotein (TIGR03751 family)
MRGNVIPQSGPTMEHVYDNMGEASLKSDRRYSANSDDLNKLHHRIQSLNTSPISTSSQKTISADALNREFHKLPNPELRMYIFPHLAGQDQVPVPGYFTVFNVYEHDYYGLGQEE